MIGALVLGKQGDHVLQPGDLLIDRLGCAEGLLRLFVFRPCVRRHGLSIRKNGVVLQATLRRLIDEAPVHPVTSVVTSTMIPAAIAF